MPTPTASSPAGRPVVVCDVLPDGMDMVGWLGVLFIVVLLTGFYVWYWPGVRRWATAFVIKRGRGAFTFNLTLHKVIGIVVWGPLLLVAFTGIAFAFPNLNSWFENATPGPPGLLPVDPTGGRGVLAAGRRRGGPRPRRGVGSHPDERTRSEPCSR